MRIALYILLLIMPIFAQAQRIEIVWVEKETGEIKRVPNNQRITSDDDKLRYSEYFALFAFGMPRSMVKTNDEMRASIYNFESDGAFGNDTNNSGDTTYEYEKGIGVTRRHHTTKGGDFAINDNGGSGTSGYNVNEMITFGFLIAPCNINENGIEALPPTDPWSNNNDLIAWQVASGWSSEIYNTPGETLNAPYFSKEFAGGRGVGIGESILADTQTGCSAYKGRDGKDPKGSWRLPTQREAQAMFTIMEQALELNGGMGLNYPDDINYIVDGDYWTSTEFFATGSPWMAWSIYTTLGTLQYSSNLQATPKYARCIRDIYMDVNEKSR